MVNKRGWIRIAEAFVSILIIIGAAILVVQGGVKENGFSEEIYEVQVAISRDISLNDNLRSEILNTGGVVEWNDFPSQTKNTIIADTPTEFDCVAKICNPGDICLIEESEKNVYVHSILMFATLTDYNPRLIKLFCSY